VLVDGLLLVQALESAVVTLVEAPRVHLYCRGGCRRRGYFFVFACVVVRTMCFCREDSIGRRGWWWGETGAY
jgi:hypothetical protein